MLPGRHPRVAGPAGVARRAAPHGAGRAAAGRLHAFAASRLRRRTASARCCRCSATRSRARSTTTVRRRDADRRGRGLDAAQRSRPANWSSRSRRRRAPIRRTASSRNSAICAAVYGCFTAQNVFLALRRGGAARLADVQRALHRLHLRTAARRRCGLAADAHRLRGDGGRARPDRARPPRARPGRHRLVRAGLRGRAAAARPADRADDRTRSAAVAVNGTINCNTNGSLPKSLQRLIDAGLDAVRVSLNAFRPQSYAAYYHPIGYGLEDVLESVERAAAARAARLAEPADASRRHRRARGGRGHGGVPAARARRHGPDEDAQHRSRTSTLRPSAVRASRSGCARRWPHPRLRHARREFHAHALGGALCHPFG